MKGREGSGGGSSGAMKLIFVVGMLDKVFINNFIVFKIIMKPTKKTTTSKSSSSKAGANTASAQGPRNASGPASKSPF